MPLADDTGPRNLPKFGGEPALWATFLTRFVGYCLLNVKGVGALHVLEDDDHNEWYPRQKHTGEGNAYRLDPDDEGGYDDTCAQQVAEAAQQVWDATHCGQLVVRCVCWHHIQHIFMTLLRTCLFGGKAWRSCTVRSSNRDERAVWRPL